MEKSELRAFWVGLIATAVFSFLLYRYLRPRREVAPRPLLITRMDSPEAEHFVLPETHKDSLVSIRGIGPATEEKLNEAGIVSFAQLAKMTPDELEPYTGNRWNPEDWIEQAREFSLPT